MVFFMDWSVSLCIRISGSSVWPRPRASAFMERLLGLRAAAEKERKKASTTKHALYHCVESRLVAAGRAATSAVTSTTTLGCCCCRCTKRPWKTQALLLVLPLCGSSPSSLVDSPATAAAACDDLSDRWRVERFTRENCD